MTELESPDGTQKKSRKADGTRAKILDVALELFRQNGFERTTMRDIAAACGIALGATYYHFQSKETIVLAYYERAHEETRESLEHAARTARSLSTGLFTLARIKLTYYSRNRRFLGALLPHAADPNDPLSPFSAGNRQLRLADQDHYRVLLRRTALPIPKDIEAHLPALLWLYHMAIILFWIYDRSENQRRTTSLNEKSVKFVVRLLKISRLPPARPFRRMMVDLLETISKGLQAPVNF